MVSFQYELYAENILEESLARPHESQSFFFRFGLRVSSFNSGQTTARVVDRSVFTVLSPEQHSSKSNWTSVCHNPSLPVSDAEIKISQSFGLCHLIFQNRGAFSCFSVHLNGTFCRVNFLSGSDFVARSLMKRALKFTRPRNDRTSVAQVGLSAFFTASIFVSVGPTPFSDRRKPMNCNWFMQYTHLSLFSVRLFALSRTSTLSRRLSCSSTVSAKMMIHPSCFAHRCNLQVPVV